MAFLTNVARWYRLVLLGIFLVATFVTTCYIGPVGVYVALFAGILSLLAFDGRMLAAALRDWGILLFLGAFVMLCISFVGSMQEPNDLTAFFDFLAFPVIIFSFALLARHAGTNKVAIVAVIATIGCTVALANGWYEVVVLGKDRAQGNTSAIFFSDMAVLLGFFSLWGLVAIKSNFRWLLIVGFPFGLGAAVYGGTRGAMLAAAALFAGFLLYLVTEKSITWRMKLITVLAVIVPSLVFLFGFFDMTRMLSLGGMATDIASGGQLSDPAANYRTMFYSAGYQAWLQSPIFGNGWWRRFAAAIPYMPQAGVDAMAHDNHAHLHNDVINFASGTGLFGVVAYFMLMAAPVVSALRSARTQHWWLRVCAAIGLALGYMTMGLTDTMFVFEIPKTMFCLSAMVIMAFWLDAPPERKAS